MLLVLLEGKMSMGFRSACGVIEEWIAWSTTVHLMDRPYLKHLGIQRVIKPESLGVCVCVCQS